MRSRTSRAAAAFQDGLDAARAQQLIPVMTDERLSGHPESGGYDSRAIRDRLHEAFPEARVLIVLREQRSVILSAYKQHVRVGGRMSLERFLNPPISHGSAVPLFRPVFYEYDHLVNAYQEAFGRDRVCVVAYEQFRKDSNAFLQSIRSFVGLEGTLDLSEKSRERSLKAFSGMAVSIQRRTNFLVRNEVNPMGWFENRKVRQAVQRLLKYADRIVPDAITKRPDERMKQRIADYCAGRYETSNSRTQELTGLDLASLGYAVAPAEDVVPPSTEVAAAGSEIPAENSV